MIVKKFRTDTVQVLFTAELVNPDRRPLGDRIQDAGDGFWMALVGVANTTPGQHDGVTRPAITSALNAGYGLTLDHIQPLAAYDPDAAIDGRVDIRSLIVSWI